MPIPGTPVIPITYLRCFFLSSYRYIQRVQIRFQGGSVKTVRRKGVYHKRKELEQILSFHNRANFRKVMSRKAKRRSN